MGIGDILSGLSTAVGGAEEGLNKRRELERQARMDLLAQQLQGVQMGNFQSERALRDAQIQDINAQRALREKQANSPAKPKYHLVQDASGHWLFVAEPTDATPSTPVPTGVTGAPKPTGKPKADPVAVRQKQAAASRLRQIGDQLTALETKYAIQNQPIGDVPWGTSMVPGLSKTPLIGGALGAASTRIGQSQMTADQQEYQRLRNEWSQVYLQTVPSATRAMAMQALNQGTFVPSPGTQLSAYPKYRQAREQAIADIEHGLGTPSTLQPAASAAPAGEPTPTGSYKKKYEDNPY